MLGFELFLRSLVIVDQSKARAPSTTEMCPETERNDTVLVRFVDGSELLRELGFGDIWPGRVEDVDHELFTGQETVGDEFSCADGYGCVVGLEREQVSILIHIAASISFLLRFLSFSISRDPDEQQQQERVTYHLERSVVDRGGDVVSEKVQSTRMRSGPRRRPAGHPSGLAEAPAGAHLIYHDLKVEHLCFILCPLRKPTFSLLAMLANL